MFNSKKIKEIVEEISVINRHTKCLQEKIESNEIFESFCTNKEEIRRSTQMATSYAENLSLLAQQQASGLLAPYRQVVDVPELEYKDISTKEVLGLILKKMGLKVEYVPERIMRDVPPEFKLIKKE